MLLVVLFRAVTYILYQKTKEGESFQVKRAEILLITGVIFAGMGWGSLAWWLYPMTNDDGTHQLLFLVLVGMAGGSITTLSYRLLPSYLFVCLTLLPILIGLYRSPDNLNIPKGFGLIIYTLFLLKNARIFQENNEQMLLIKEEALAREKKLKITSQKAEQASRAKSLFLANMSHEIRTPMNSIIGRTRLALDGKLDRDLKAHLETIQVSSENLLSLINDILDFSKIEAGELQIDNKPFDLHDTVEASLNTIRVLGRDKQKTLVLTCTIAADVPQVVTGCAMRLRQILLNLLSNAVKFTDNGSIDLAVSRMASDRDEAHRIQFMVQDTGRGIALDKQEHIFAEFTQEDDSLTRKYGGTGLGLAICRKLCRLMGGDIEVTSSPGHGSTFMFSLSFQPCQLEDLPAKTVASNAERVTIPPLSVLLVEDNESNRILARMVLERDHHQITEAHDGLQALTLLTGRVFDVILMDVQMPVMDGLTASRIIRGSEGNAPVEGVNDHLAIKLYERLCGNHIPIIAMTGNAMSGDREECLASGMDDYLSKPFKPEELTSILRNHVLGRRVSDKSDTQKTLTPGQGH